MQKNRLYFLLFISVVFLSIGTIILSILITQQPQILISRAEGDPNPVGSTAWCTDHCTGDPECRDKPDFYDEACCLKIQETGDPLECPWPQRGWCMPEHCATILENVNPQRCASPRKGWCDLCKQNCPDFANRSSSNKKSSPPFVGCVGGGDWLCMCLDNGEYKHDCAPQGSEPQQKYSNMCNGDINKAQLQWRYDASTWLTKKGDCCKGQSVCKEETDSSSKVIYNEEQEEVETIPSPIIPTKSKVLLFPTKASQKQTDFFNESTTKQNTANQKSFSLPSFPKITLPKIDAKINVFSVNKTARKPFDLIKSIFTTISQLDKKLESTINNGLSTIVDSINRK